MSVRPKKFNKRTKTEDKPATCAADILKPEHPVHSHFTQWLGEHTATKRKARAFLAKYPHYREAQSA
jgi:hypothetical protein